SARPPPCPYTTLFRSILGQRYATVTTQAIAARKKGSADTATIRVQDPSSCAAMKVHGSAYVHVYAAPGVTAPGGFVYVASNCGRSEEHTSELQSPDHL